MNISQGVVYDGNLFYPSYSAFSCVNVPWIGATRLGKCTNPIRKTNLGFKDVTNYPCWTMEDIHLRASIFNEPNMARHTQIKIKFEAMAIGGLHVDPANILFKKKNLRFAFYRTPMFVGPLVQVM